MKTTTTTVRIRLDQAIIIEKTDFNVSEFLRDKLDEKFGCKDFIEAQEKKLLEELENLKQLKKDRVPKENTSNDEKKWLEGAKNRVLACPGELIENCRVYNLKFKKKMTSEEFKELIK